MLKSHRSGTLGVTMRQTANATFLKKRIMRESEKRREFKDKSLTTSFTLHCLRAYDPYPNA